MTGIHEVEVRQVPLTRLTPVIGDERAAALQQMAAVAREELAGAAVWTVTGGPAVGGVSELNRSLLAYTLDAGVDARWCAVAGDARFGATTRTLHSQLHGFAGARPLASEDAEHYGSVGDALGAELAEIVRAGDVVLLHDAPTAPLTPRLAQAGAHVIWRCHVGADGQNELTEEAWGFLEPHLEQCQAFIFSRAPYAPDWLPESAVTVIPPSIDPYSPKNEELTPAEVASVLRDAGILGRGAGGGALAGGRGTGRGGSTKRFRRPGGTPAAITARASFADGGEPLDPAAPVVLQVSRWDRLKDMAWVLAAHVEATLSEVPEAQLVLAGPAPAADGGDGGDDAGEVLAECVAALEAIPGAARDRVRLVTLPAGDVDENALVVNALQRHATVVVQKSLAEGFGLTVAEAMWKARPVVASAVGGIVDQLTPGTGVLLEDPADTKACGHAVAELLADRDHAASLGEAARRRVLAEFVGDQHLAAYAQLMGNLHLRMR